MSGYSAHLLLQEYKTMLKDCYRDIKKCSQNIKDLKQQLQFYKDLKEVPTDFTDYVAERILVINTTIESCKETFQFIREYLDELTQTISEITC